MILMEKKSHLGGGAININQDFSRGGYGYIIKILVWMEKGYRVLLY